MAARFFCCSEDKGFVMAIEEISLLPAADELPKKESPFNIEFVSVWPPVILSPMKYVYGLCTTLDVSKKNLN